MFLLTVSSSQSLLLLFRKHLKEEIELNTSMIFEWMITDREVWGAASTPWFSPPRVFISPRGSRRPSFFRQAISVFILLVAVRKTLPLPGLSLDTCREKPSVENSYPTTEGFSKTSQGPETPTPFSLLSKARQWSWSFHISNLKGSVKNFSNYFP